MNDKADSQLEPDDLPGDQVPGEEGEDHEATREDEGHPAYPGDLDRSSKSKLDGLGHLLTGILEAVLSPEEGEHEGLGEVAGNLNFIRYVDFGRAQPHNINVSVSLDDHIQLKSRPDGERKSKLWRNVNEELMFVLLRTEAGHRVQEGLVSLVEVREAESYRSSFGKARTSLAGGEIEDP